LLSGRELTALELQCCFLEAAQRFVAAGCCEGLVPDAEEILRLWGDTLEHLKAIRLEALAARLDWVLKFTLLQQASAARRELAWHSPELRHLDQIYASLDPAEGLYWACERSGLVQRLVPERQISRAMQEPPPDTRAWTRAALLLVADPAAVEMVDWDFIRFRLADPAQAGGPRHYFVSLADPLRHTRSELSAKLPESGTFEDMLAALDAMPVPPLETGGSQAPVSPAAPVPPPATAQADSQSAGDSLIGRDHHD
jgi:proteasome accessory factor A